MYICTVIFLIYKFNNFGDGDTELSTIILHSLNKLSELKETLGLGSVAYCERLDTNYVYL
jgi:hypothetical protein